MYDSLLTFDQRVRSRGDDAGSPCADLGAVLPFPYAFGMGYIFSRALLRWLGTSTLIAGWVAEAKGAEREALQWQVPEPSQLIVTHDH